MKAAPQQFERFVLDAAVVAISAHKGDAILFSSRGEAYRIYDEPNSFGLADRVVVKLTVPDYAWLAILRVAEGSFRPMDKESSLQEVQRRFERRVARKDRAALAELVASTGCTLSRGGAR